METECKDSKKVEDASDKAADVAFGLVPTGKSKGRAVAKLMTEEVRDQEYAYTEAQELLNQWINEKVMFDVDDGFDDLEAWRRARKNKDDIINKQKEAKDDDYDDYSVERLTRLALEDDFMIDEAAIYERVKRNALGDSDPYANLYEMEDDEAVHTVLKNMMSKEMVKDTFKRDLGLENTSKPDPRTKMELRHKMVKDNRERRHKEEEKKKTEAQLKKEARLQAQQLILKEQKDRELRSRREEMELKKEMARIRKEMHEERKKKEEEIKRRREEEELMNKLAREELERQRAEEDKEKILSLRQENERKHKLMMRKEAIKSRITSKNLQCLHRHFTAWYDLVLSRRLLMGKIKAMSDWKLMLKVWGAWRNHVKGRRLDIETERHERNLIDSQRKELTAERHWTMSSLRKCFTAWQIFTQESIERRDLERDKEKTKSKMMALLNAVAEGKFVKEEEGGQESSRTRQNSARSQSSHPGNNKKENTSQAPARKQAWGEDQSLHSSRSEATVSQTSSAAKSDRRYSASQSSIRSVPVEPWQVNRQHLKMLRKESSKTDVQDIEVESLDGEQRTHTDAEIRKRFGTQPWMNRHYVVNNLEHRYTAQQQALKEQQNQIREQQRMIEQLQYEQRQQALKQQLLNGSIATPLPPMKEIEVPPAGKQIPRGDHADENKNNIDIISHSAKNKTVVNTENKEEKVQTTIDTDRSCLTTSRSETTTASNTTKTSSVNPHNTKYLQVLKNMEERAAERARIKAEREEKRRKQEEEKLAQMEKEQAEKQKEIEAEKQAKAAAYRQKKLLEKQKEEEKQKQMAHIEKLNKMADDHYVRSILKYRGLLPFKKLVSMSKRNWVKAIKHQEKVLLRQVLHAWRRVTDEELDKKNRLADQMHQFLVIKHSFHSWRNYKYHAQFLEIKAERHYLDNLKSKFFQAWTEWVVAERENSLNQMELAHEHYLQYLVKKSFNGWRYLKERQKKEEERKKRKLELRKKVAELIPDYTPDKSVSVKGSEDFP
ncbi:coiled-coil domain-containing protein 191-like [Physella acuta]|uniref:coiled-coil domain-containing protein 191-like n=1 Tax=Physella acuta TaxID=109671 RepID=UPI0027DE65C4|nr:coiled-coil domain-containing protein 191-like [Physella acuta]